MRVAPDFYWVVLALPCLAALGLGVALLAAPRRALERAERAQLLALAGAAGLLLDYALGTLIPSLGGVLVAGILVACAGVTWALVQRRAAFADLAGIGWGRWLVTVAVLMLFAGPILFEPLQDWDARSLWFFNAKRIFFGGGLAGGDWTHPAYGFSHPDYPMLLPLLGAQFAHAFGLWNEYIPKGSLLVLLAPVVVGLLGLARGFLLSFVLVAGALLLGTENWVWNGYADSYLALYGVVAMLYLARWLSSSAPLDLATGGAFVGVALNLKNEGSLLAVCVVATLLAFFLFSRQSRAALNWRRYPAGVWLALALPWIGFVAWALTKRSWRLTNDLQLGSGSVQRAWQRISGAEIGLVADALVLHSGAGAVALLFLGTVALAWATRTRLQASAWFPALVATAYFAGIFLVFLATPHPLAWHLSTSADRTMVLSLFGWLGSTFLVLEALQAQARGLRPLETTGSRI